MMGACFPPGFSFDLEESRWQVRVSLRAKREISLWKRNEVRDSSLSSE
jgi:hypothetical protein